MVKEKSRVSLATPLSEEAIDAKKHRDEEDVQHVKTKLKKRKSAQNETASETGDGDAASNNLDSVCEKTKGTEENPSLAKKEKKGLKEKQSEGQPTIATAADGEVCPEVGVGDKKRKKKKHKSVDDRTGLTDPGNRCEESVEIEENPSLVSTIATTMDAKVNCEVDVGDKKRKKIKHKSKDGMTGQTDAENRCDEPGEMEENPSLGLTITTTVDGEVTAEVDVGKKKRKKRKHKTENDRTGQTDSENHCDEPGDTRENLSLDSTAVADGAVISVVDVGYKQRKKKKHNLVGEKNGQIDAENHCKDFGEKEVKPEEMKTKKRKHKSVDEKTGNIDAENHFDESGETEENQKEKKRKKRKHKSVDERTGNIDAENHFDESGETEENQKEKKRKKRKHKSVDEKTGNIDAENHFDESGETEENQKEKKRKKRKHKSVDEKTQNIDAEDHCKESGKIQENRPRETKVQTTKISSGSTKPSEANPTPTAKGASKVNGGKNNGVIQPKTPEKMREICSTYLRVWKAKRIKWTFIARYQRWLTENMLNKSAVPDDVFAIFLEFISGGKESARRTVKEIATKAIKEAEDGDPKLVRARRINQAIVIVLTKH